ncbi:hypothetical protein [Nostoc sp. MG11]|nr:hypothetical protein [Nostoc sp. MG11]
MYIKNEADGLLVRYIVLSRGYLPVSVNAFWWAIAIAKLISSAC